MKTVILFFMAFQPEAYGKITVKNCNDQAKENISKALNMFARNLSQISQEKFSYNLVLYDSMDGKYDMLDGNYDENRLLVPAESRFQMNLTPAEVGRIKDALYRTKVKIKCAEPTYKACEGANGFVGHSGLRLFAGRNRNQIVLCSHQNSNSCEFYSLVAHELSHIANIPMHPEHNSPSSLGIPRHEIDKIYKIHKAMEQVCHYEEWNHAIQENGNIKIWK